MMGEETTRARLAAGRIHACKAIAGDAMRSGTNHAVGKHIFMEDFIFSCDVIRVCVNVNTTDATTGATALLLPVKVRARERRKYGADVQPPFPPLTVRDARWGWAER
jgi:hypothetical protein